MIEATKSLDLATARTLLEARPDLLNVTNRQGRNPLHLACSARCADLGLPNRAAVIFASFLLDMGADVEGLGMSGRDPCPPLFFAVAHGRNPELVAFLIARGGQVPSVPGGGLFAAAWWDDVENLELLLNAGAEIDRVVGVTPFLAAWCWKRFEAARFLALRRADVNYQDDKGRTALFHGVQKQYEPALLRWLVENGASPDVPDHTGQSPRLKASRKRDRSFFEALTTGLNMGEDVYRMSTAGFGLAVLERPNPVAGEGTGLEVRDNN